MLSGPPPPPGAGGNYHLVTMPPGPGKGDHIPWGGGWIWGAEGTQARTEVMSSCGGAECICHRKC